MSFVCAFLTYPTLLLESFWGVRPAMCSCPGLDGGDRVVDPRCSWIAAPDEIGIWETRADVVVVVVAQGERVHPVNLGSEGDRHLERKNLHAAIWKNSTPALNPTTSQQLKCRRPIRNLDSKAHHEELCSRGEIFLCDVPTFSEETFELAKCFLRDFDGRRDI